MGADTFYPKIIATAPSQNTAHPPMTISLRTDFGAVWMARLHRAVFLNNPVCGIARSAFYEDLTFLYQTNA